MRGILYRTDDEGNPLPKPEVKVSAIRGNNIKVYKTQEAKQEALANGDIKPGDVVLSGGDENERKFEYANTTINLVNNPYTAVATGFAYISLYKDSNAGNTITISVDGQDILNMSPPSNFTTATIPLNKGSVLAVTGWQYAHMTFITMR